MNAIAQYLIVVTRTEARVVEDINELYAKEDALPLPPKPRRRRVEMGTERLRRLVGLSPA